MRIEPALRARSFLLVLLLIVGIFYPYGLQAQVLTAGIISNTVTPNSSGPRIKALAGKRSKPSEAQQAPSKSGRRHAAAAPLKLPPIIVVLTPTGIPEPLGEVGTTTSVISQRQAQIQQTHELPDLLRQVPGVEITQSGSPGTITDVSIRGSTPA